MKPLAAMEKSLSGANRLPAGVVPLATDKPGSMVVITAVGCWRRWWPGTRSYESMPHRETQRAVMAVLCEQMGGTSADIAARLGVSPRTVEAWRQGKAALTAKAAIRIAEEVAQ